MKIRVIGRLAVAIAFGIASTFSLAADEMPWTFNAKRAEGYTIDLVSVSPEPGTPLVVGSVVDFKVTVRYVNSLSPKAKVVLVFQTEKGSAKAEGENQVVQEVSEKSGELTLEDKLTVPKKAKQLLLFVPLMPENLDQTDGEIVIRYPIKKK
jgi:hypothetical protein